MRVGIIGLGAIGGAVAARLAASRLAGESLALAAGSERSVRALREGGLHLSGEGAPLHLGGAALPHLGAGLAPELAPYDLLLLCTRAEATDAALEAALPLLGPEGTVACLQNGLPEERVAARAGAARTLGAVINWSATAEVPGRIAVTGRGNFLLGSVVRGAELRLAGTAAVLGRAFPVRLTANLAGARWSKLAFNCAISTLGAISGLSFGELALRGDGRALALRTIGEVVRVARARGVALERVSGLSPALLADAGGPGALLLRPLRQALFLLASRARPRQRSGMLARLLAGRTSGQIEDLNGAVVRAARAAGVAVPLNERLLALVHSIERGEEKLGPHQLERLAAAL